MKHALLTAILVLAFVAPGFAKNGILMGKVTSRKGKALCVSEIIIAGSGITAAASLKNDGLYYSDMIPEGQYELSFVIRGVSYKTNVTFTGNDGSPATKPIFYNFVLSAGKLSLAMSDEDPFATGALNAVKDKPALFDFGGGRHMTLVLPSEATSTADYNSNRRYFYLRTLEKRAPLPYHFMGHQPHRFILDNILPAPPKLKFAPLHIINNEPLLEGLEMKK